MVILKKVARAIVRHHKPFVWTNLNLDMIIYVSHIPREFGTARKW